MKADRTERRKLSDAITFLVSLTPDERAAERYAFTRQAEQSNLYRIPLP